jgi:uncharacterized protein
MTAEPGALLGGLVEFVQRLRALDLPVGVDQALTFYRAVGELEPSVADDVYWAGRTTLLTSRTQLATYDLAFQQFFLGESPVMNQSAPPPHGARTEQARVFAPPGTARPAPEEPGVDIVGTLAADVQVLRTKRFAEYTDDELARLRQLVGQLRLDPPRRRTRRTTPSPRGSRLDVRRTVHRAMRTHGDLVRLDRRTRRTRARPLVLLLDVSGSMTPYARALLQFAHATAHGIARVETFCFGTRLTRITDVVRRKRPDEALLEAAALVSDWDGGTRIGSSLRTFLRDWGRHGMARGAVVVICSDGLERGDPDELAAEMRRLARLAHRIVWVNPLKGDPRYRPLARGMAAALPYVDEFVAGHDLASLEALMDLVSTLR